MPPSGTYRVAWTWARYNDADVMVYETGRSPVYGPVTVAGNFSVGGAYSTDSQINYIRIYRTLNGGSVYYFDKRVANDTDGGTWWTTLSQADSTLDDQASAYFTNKGYETKRLYAAGVLPPMRYVVEAAARLWGAGRMQRYGTNEDSTLYWSELAPNFRDWPITNGVSSFAQTITGLYEWNELVYVFTRTSRWRVTPSDFNEGMEFDKLEADVGCIGHHTIQKIGSAILWLGQEGFYASSGDAEPVMISTQIEGTIRTLRKDLSLNFVSRHDREHHLYRCWVATGTSRLNNECLVYDYSPGLLAGRWTIEGGFGRTAMYVSSGIGPDGQTVYLLGDHLGNVWQEDVGESDGASVGGTYQGTLGYGTTTTSTTTTSTTTTTTSTTTTTTTSTTT